MWVVLNLSYLGFVDKALTQVGDLSHIFPLVPLQLLSFFLELHCVYLACVVLLLYSSPMLFIFMVWISALCNGRSQSTHSWYFLLLSFHLDTELFHSRLSTLRFSLYQVTAHFCDILIYELISTSAVLNLWLQAPQGSLIGYPEYQIFILQFIMVKKIRIMK